MAIIRYPADHEKHPGERVSRTGTCPHCQADVEQWAFSMSGSWEDATANPGNVFWGPRACPEFERKQLHAAIGT